MRRSVLARSVLAAVIAALVPWTAAAATFPDTANTPYAQAADDLSRLGIVQGIAPGLFGPYRLVSRAQLAACIVRSLNQRDLAQRATPFSDVPRSHWASGYVAVAAGLGCIDGVGEGRFAPEADVTVAQAVTMIIRLLGRTGMAQGAPWPTGYLAAAQQLGLLTGVASSGYATRGDIALMLRRAVFAIEHGGTGKTLAQSHFGLNPVTKVVVNLPAPSAAIGQAVQCTATSFDAAGRVVDVPVTWSVAPARGVMGANGLFVPTESGTCLITATAAGVTGSAALGVAGDPFRLSLQLERATLLANGRSTAAVTVRAVDAVGVQAPSHAGEVLLQVHDVTRGTLSANVLSLSGGAAQATLTATTLAGATYITATSPGLLAGRVDFTTTAPAPVSLRLTVSPDRLAVGAGATSLVEVTLLDAEGHPIANHAAVPIPVLISSSSPAVAFLNLAYLAINPGQQAVTALLHTGQVPGATVVSATPSWGGLAGASATVIAAVPGPAARLGLIRQPSPVTADGQSGLRVDVGVYDAQGNLRTGDQHVRVRLTVVEGQAGVMAPVVATVNGAASFILTATAPGTVRVIATAVNAALSDLEAAVSFGPGPAQRLVLAADPHTKVAADTVSTVALVARAVDAFGHTVTAFSGPVSFQCATPSPVTALPAVTTVSAVNGVARLDVYTTSAVGTDTYRASSGTLGVSNDLAITAAIVGYPNKLQVQPVSGSLTVGGTATVRVFVLDTRDDLVTRDKGRSVTLRVVEGKAAVSGPSLTDRGVATFTVSTAAAGQVRVVAESAGLTPDSFGQVVYFAPGQPVRIVLTAAPGELAAGAGRAATVSGRLLDWYGNQLPGWDTVTLTLAGIGTLSSPHLHLGGSVQYLAPAIAGEAMIIGSSANYAVSPVTVSCYAVGPPARVVVAGVSGLTAGFDGVISARIVDANGRTVTSLSTGPDLTAMGLTLSGGSGRTAISTNLATGLSGFWPNGATTAAQVVVYGRAMFLFRNLSAETVTLTPLVYYRGVPLPVVSGTAATVAGVPVRLSVAIDRPVLPVDGGLAATVTVSITDTYANVAAGASDLVTVTANTTQHLDIMAQRTYATLDGSFTFAVRPRAGSPGGVTTLTFAGQAYSAPLTQAITTDLPPAAPSVSAMDNWGADAYIDPVDLGARVTVSLSPRYSEQTVCVYVNGVLKPLVAAAGSLTPAPAVAPGSTWLVAYINAADLGGPGVKEIRAAVFSAVGVSALSAPAYVTVR